jgi:[ribosomal protein S5]-alanine N-acetyltransferase
MNGIQIPISTLAMLDAEEEGGDALAAMMGVKSPSSWPPEHNDADTRAWFRAMIAQAPDEPGYGSRYIIADGCLVGTCGFKGPPNANGEVEIGYSVIPEEQRRGLATRAVAALLAFAFEDRRVVAVRAETLPTGLASQKVLIANGFAADGTRDDPDEGPVACFRYARTIYATR